MAYIRLSKMEHEAAETKNLLELLSDEVRNNVISNVKEAMLAMEMERNSLTEIFPELSPSEIEIYRLVIMGKSLNEVCSILRKSESNITCQRSNIRKNSACNHLTTLKKYCRNASTKGKTVYNHQLHIYTTIGFTFIVSKFRNSP